jgi:transposase InsO family protein
MWLLDSGASTHFTHDIRDFIEYTPFTPSERAPVKTASNVIYIEGKGTVLLQHYVDNKMVTTRLYPVLYIPNLTTRLLSMGEFLQQGMRVSGDHRSITLSSKHEPTISCKPLFNGQTIYWLDASISHVEVMNVYPCIYKVDSNLMHKCLGHLSKDVLINAKKHTKGFPNGVQIPNKLPVCPGCAKGKMPAAAHPPSITRASAAFQRIHSDLKSLPVDSYHHYKYFISFFDDYTSYAWIVCLRTKDAALGALKQFLAMIENQHSTTVKEWMSDAGGEYKSEAFLKTLKDAGIKILQSAPHTPQQNGQAECFMRTLMDKAEAMRHEACLPQSWWEFAVQHATHVYNRTPLRHLEWRTPYQLLNGEVPDISHL